MKKNPGRKERRRLARQNRLAAGRERAKHNEFLQKHPWLTAKKKEVKKNGVA
jgi:hypothetical protein